MKLDLKDLFDDPPKMGVTKIVEKTEKSDSDDKCVDAAQDIINAQNEGDAKALDKALKRHYALCESDEPDEVEETEED